MTTNTMNLKQYKMRVKIHVQLRADTKTITKKKTSQILDREFAKRIRETDNVINNQFAI